MGEEGCKGGAAARSIVVVSERSLLYPLDAFYARARTPLPPVRPLAGEEVPEPYRQLLVHHHDMTPTLEAFHGGRISLRLIERRVEADALWRQVVLELNGSRQPVEYGAIVIYLDHFPPAAREQILEGRRPLGTLLAEHTIEHASRPQGFFRVVSDALINEALRLPGPSVLYGRRNVHVATGNRLLADIVEIMPPLPRRPGP